MRDNTRRRPSAPRTLLCGPALAAVALALSFGAPPASAQDTDALILLGKNAFWDKQLSTPRGKQSCASCHDPRVGWTLPLGNINKTTVGAPGAQPGALGGRKPQNNSYVQGFLGEYTPGPLGPFTFGGAFWDGRAEGCGADDPPDPGCQLGSGNVSETITSDDLPDNSPHVAFLGPVADQALNPTARPGVEQNTLEKTVCQMVKTAKYKALFEQAWGVPIDCKVQGDPPPYHTSFKRIAVAVAAYQGSPDVNSFSSPRDDCIRDFGGFPTCGNLNAEVKEGHDLFYGAIVPVPQPRPADFVQSGAGCSVCHNSFLRPGAPPTSDPGNELLQAYSDTAYHSIALPLNPDLSRDDEDPGLFAHDDLPGDVAGLGEKGLFKTAPLRNVGKNELNIVKAYMHNGYFKNLPNIVHYYNTRFDGTPQDTVDPNPPGMPQKTVCEDVGLEEATAAEAIANNCWPQPEFPSTTPILGGLLGNLGLTSDQEAALVAFLESLTDAHTPSAPSTVK